MRGESMVLGVVAALGLALAGCGGTETRTVTATVTTTVATTVTATGADERPTIELLGPLPNEPIESPIHAFGTANTFEANFEFDLVTADGKLLAHDFVTATSGTGQRGVFQFDIDFEVDRPTRARLVVFESSAKDGSRIHVRETPLRLLP